MAYFSKAFPKIFVGSGSIRETGHPKDLVAGQIGLVNYKTHALMASGSTISNANPAYFAMGSYHSKDKIGPHGGYKESDKTKGINPNYVSKYWVSEPTAAQNHIVQIGWDGVSDCTVPSFNKDQTYWLRVEVKGSPVYRTMRRNFYKTYGVHTGCSTSCADVCVDSADRKAVFQGWADAVNQDPIMGKFVRAFVGHEDDGDDENLPEGSVAYNVYTLTYDDTGDVKALAAVQVEYPTLTIERLSYVGITSVYQTIKTSSAPADFDSISWVDAAYDVYKVPRTLCITIPATDTTDGSDDLDAAITFYTDLVDLVADSLIIHQYSAVDALGNCTVVLELQQFSSNYVKLDCDFKSEAVYANIPPYMGEVWADCPCDDAADDTTGKYFLRIEGAYTDDEFNNCSFLPEDLFELSPVEIQVAMVDETNDVCLFNGLNVRTVQLPKQATGTGEELLRELIIYLGYKQEPYMSDPRMREVFNYPLFDIVDRKKSYKKYFVLHNVPRWSNPTSTFDNDQYLITFAFEDGVDTQDFEDMLTDYVTSGNTGVSLETK